MFRGLLVVLMGLLVSGPGFAAETEESAVMMDEVVVTATRQAEELATVPANVTLITQDEIERSAAQNVPELLRSIPGVLVSDIAGNGRNYTVDLRGFGETASLNTLVLVDGRRINQADLSGSDWVLIPKEQVERVEIVRGGRGSVLYGDNATGGVINIVTKGGAEGVTGVVGTRVGSYDTFQGYAAVSAGVDALSIAVNGNYRTSDGYRDNSDTLAKSIGVNLDYDLSDRLSLRLNAGHHEDETGQPAALYKSQLESGTSRTSTNAPFDQVETKDWYLQGGAQYFLTDNSYLDVDASVRNREAVFSYVSIFAAGQTEIDTVAFSPKLVFSEKLSGFDSKIVLGVDYQKDEEAVFTDNFMGANSRDLSKESYGYYAHGEVALSENLSISAGLRKEKAKFKFDWIDGGATNAKTMDEDLFTVGGTYKISESTVVYVNYAKSYRTPVLDEFYNLFFDTFDSTLEAQISKDIEAGMRVKLEKSTTVGVNLFRVVTENEIFLNPLFYANENLDGDSHRKGVELSFSTMVRDILFNGGYTYMDAEIDGGQYDGMELPNVPKHQLTLGLRKMFGERIEFGLNGSYVGERRYISDFDNDKGRQDDYFYVTSQLSYLLDKGKIYFVVNNLLNEEYSEYGVDYGSSWVDGSPIDGLYPSPEINFVVGVDFEF
jgi:iron complex outermembrane receptor protein